MAKPKKAGGGDDKAEDTVLEYLRKQNRPYSATDICANLHNTVSKTAIQKILTQLHEKQLIHGKQYGKAWIYAIKQDDSQTVSPADLEALDRKYVDLKAEKDRLAEELKLAQSGLNSLTSAMTNEQIQKELATLAKENAKCVEKLEDFRSDRKAISDEERKEVEIYLEKMRKEWKTRKAKFDDMWGAIMEGYPGNPKDLMEELSIETDKAVGVELSRDPLQGLYP
ncbi:homologous-pairing protein 2 [Cladochytrium replicatum]|nr:homologous-pairing protein 2 [Cladochytrium replicatum]